ncbi:MAG: ABC transporter substrate-binding protein [Alphaproteobacteria bacterium]|nr:MAG: ABC transporter substrate-binding protein [Alphaproteobacteria bacterium]
MLRAPPSGPAFRDGWRSTGATPAFMMPGRHAGPGSRLRGVIACGGGNFLRFSAASRLPRGRAWAEPSIPAGRGGSLSCWELRKATPKRRAVRIEQRWTGGDAERLRAYTAELVASAPDVIVANPTPIVAALKQATRTIPIVFALVSDPVSSGFVESWAQPGGNITGFTSFESSMAGKWLQALKQMAPRVTQVTVVFNPETAASGGEIFLRPLEEAASPFGFQVRPARVRSAAEIAGLGDPSASGGTTGLMVVPDIFTTNHRDEIIALAARQRLPALYPFRFFAASGGLMSYGIDTLDVFRRAASYVDRILKGAKVGELPVQGPAKFELAINMRTANSLGLTVPPSLLALADEVIE